MYPNKALRMHNYGGPEVLQIDEILTPEASEGQVLVRVRAAGINGLDWKVREGFLRSALPLPLPAILGAELAGEVLDVGPNVTRLKVGDRVMGPMSGLGAYAEIVAVDAANLSHTPEALDDTTAAAIPIAALTAWQSLRAAGDLFEGEKVLIHGAAGAVGGFAVQFARAAGAIVTATASSSSRDYVLNLGADRVIDRHTERFEELIDGVDLVLDLVGGETLDRSWQVLTPTGAIVSAAAPDIAARAPANRRGLWFSMRPDHEQLRLIADAVAAGAVRSTIAEITDFSHLAFAIERNKTGHSPGKIVLDMML